MTKDYSIAKMWNAALEKTNERPVEPRDRMYASELGRSDVDIWLKMKGEIPTNPPNDRAHRKFHAGDLYEWFVFLILKKCGILINKQLPVKYALEGCVPVSGKLDFTVGGIPDYDKGQQEIDALIEALEMPPLFKQITSNFIEILKAEYPDGLKEKVIEVKSTAVFGFEKVEKTGKPLGGHDKQNYHYVRGTDVEGSICYISRDDLRMIEIPIMPHDQKLEKQYVEKVKRVSDYYLKNEMPPIEPVVLWDTDMQRFSKNFNVEYSPFLKKLYNIERPDVYDEMYSPMVERWNRVVGRIKAGAKMTAKNEEAIKEMLANGFDITTFNIKVDAKEKPAEDQSE